MHINTVRPRTIHLNDDEDEMLKAFFKCCREFSDNVEHLKRHVYTLTGVDSIERLYSNMSPADLMFTVYPVYSNVRVELTDNQRSDVIDAMVVLCLLKRYAKTHDIEHKKSVMDIVFRLVYVISYLTSSGVELKSAVTNSSVQIHDFNIAKRVISKLWYGGSILHANERRLLSKSRDKERSKDDIEKAVDIVQEFRHIYHKKEISSLDLHFGMIEVFVSLGIKYEHAFLCDMPEGVNGSHNIEKLLRKTINDYITRHGALYDTHLDEGYYNKTIHAQIDKLERDQAAVQAFSSVLCVDYTCASPKALSYIFAGGGISVIRSISKYLSVRNISDTDEFVSYHEDVINNIYDKLYPYMNMVGIKRRIVSPSSRTVFDIGKMNLSGDRKERFKTTLEKTYRIYGYGGHLDTCDENNFMYSIFCKESPIELHKERFKDITRTLDKEMIATFQDRKSVV